MCSADGESGHDTAKCRQARILILEDDIDRATYYRVVLRTAGYDSHIACCAAAALTAMDTFSPDAAVLSFTLASGNGQPLIEEIRGAGRFEKMPIIVIREPGANEAEIQPADVQGVASLPVAPSKLRELLLNCNVGPTVED